MKRFGTLVWVPFVLFACNNGKSADRAAAAPPVAAKTVADTGATTNPPAELPMDVQHHTMDSVQANYLRMMAGLQKKDRTTISTGAKNIASLADRIPVFMIHKAGVTDDSLKQWARILKGQAMRVGQLADGDSLDAAMPIASVMAGTCQTCHDMYKVDVKEEEHDEHGGPVAKHPAKKGASKK